MSATKKRPERAPNSRQSFAFVRWDFTPSEQAECKAWEVSHDELFDMVQRLNEQSYSISLKFDVYHKCFGCFMTQPDDKHPNYNLCLTGRGSAPAKALKQVLYKHKMCDGIWPFFDYQQVAGESIDD